jgi:ribose transport system substrate-binding protein
MISHPRLFTTIAAIAVSVGLVVSSAMAADPDAVQRTEFFKDLKGKTIAFVPIAMGDPLFQGWDYALRTEAAEVGMNYVLRDSNWSTTSMEQAITALIAQKPDILVAHNINVQLLSRDLKKATEAGIHVIQLNLESNTSTDAFVGADWTGIGEQTGEYIVKDCGAGSGRSGKVLILAGQLTAADSVLENAAILKVLNSHPEIKVVANQATEWQADKAREITATILQQNPDLCAIFGHWDVFTLGAGQAVKQAGLTGKALVYTSGGGDRRACDALQEGLFDRYWNYNSLRQGHDTMTIAKGLLQSKQAPGASHAAYYSPMTVLTPQNVKPNDCWDLPKAP